MQECGCKCVVFVIVADRPGCHCEVVATGRVGMRMVGEGGRTGVGGDPWQPGGRLVTGKLFWEAPSQ